MLSSLDADTNTEEDEELELEEQTEESENYEYVRISELYGHKGLSTVVSSTKTLQYEYKAGPYEGFFKAENIGNYSSKIKNICDIIYNKNTGIVSEGIILIYSQYLYGGLIPMALALEEMGFTKYNSKSLFHTPPTRQVDARTMQEPVDKKDFKPARYIMITGNLNLSPNNDNDVKAITNIDNIYDEVNNVDISGEKIKVVLISQSGSEGIDFKAIRQVHILEPWYNMNRIEQVIGRAVRNLSHKWLPLKKRNVQIFLHGTVLKEQKSESADVYIYRVAEYKAKQIGVVTRLLKENAVDCLLNYDQTNFSQEKMRTTLNIVLSTNPTEMIPFQVGDSPYSMTCDYMENCDYKCNSKLPETTNEYTYGEAFARANIDTIMNRIRSLFKESFFYKKTDLLKRINPHSRYATIQIYVALTEFIENQNMYIRDKYDRLGRLVNIGEYYLFQPVELNNKNISLYERSVPFRDVPDKIEMIQERERERDIEIEPLREKEIRLHMRESIDTETPIGKLVNLLENQYNLSIDIINKTEDEIRQIEKIRQGEEVWIEKYTIIGIVLYQLSKYPILLNMDTVISEQALKQLLVEYIIDSLLPDEKLLLLLFSLNSTSTMIEKNDFFTIMKSYCDNLLIHLIDDKGKKSYGYISYKNTTQYYLYYKEDTEWTYKKVSYTKTAKYSDSQKMITQQEENMRNVYENRECNKIVGFVDIKDNNIMVFKTKVTEKDPTVKRLQSGRICNKTTNKSQMTETLNSIVGNRDMYINDKEKGGEKQGRSFYNNMEITNTNVYVYYSNENELCYFTEFILRYYEKILYNGKVWFLNYETQSFLDFPNIKPNSQTNKIIL